MYTNIEKKIMTLAKVIGVGGLIAIAAGLVLAILDIDEFLWALIGGAVGGLMMIVSSWPLYGFGQMIGDVRAIKDGAASDKASAPEELPTL